MQAYAKLLIAVSVATGVLGGAAGYALHVAPSASPIVCNSVLPTDRTSAVQEPEPVGASSLAQHSTLDWSWQHWPTLTDF
jgi:hypothetical protein